MKKKWWIQVRNMRGWYLLRYSQLIAIYAFFRFCLVLINLSGGSHMAFPMSGDGSHKSHQKGGICISYFSNY